MTLRHADRIRRAFLLLLPLALAAGCSKAPTAPKANVVIVSHTDADDIAQAVGTMVSADNGGWFFAFKTVAETLAVPVSSLAMSSTPVSLAAAERSATPLSVPTRVLTS